MSKSEREQRTVLYVFIASPGDLNEERTGFREVIEEVNSIKANSMGIQLEPLGWEVVAP